MFLKSFVLGTSPQLWAEAARSSQLGKFSMARCWVKPCLVGWVLRLGSQKGRCLVAPCMLGARDGCSLKAEPVCPCHSSLHAPLTDMSLESRWKCLATCSLPFPPPLLTHFIPIPEFPAFEPVIWSPPSFIFYFIPLFSTMQASQRVGRYVGTLARTCPRYLLPDPSSCKSTAS